MRTHRPLGRWPHVSKRLFLRRLRIGVLATLVAVPVVAAAFAFWAAGDPPTGNGGSPFDHWREGLEAALIATAIFWALAATAFGIIRWIRTGEAPSA